MRVNTLVEWAKAVRQRDGNKCVVCGDRQPVTIEVHHIVPRCHWKHMELETNNGICLCHSCHRLAHKSVYQGRSIKGNQDDNTD